MTGFIVSVFPFRNRVSSKEAFEGLELGEGKPSRPVLRGPGGRKAAWLLGSNRRKTQQPLESSTIFEPVVIVARLVFFCSALPALMARPIPHRSSQLSRPPFFCHSFSWALLQANSCVRQLRGFCFPGSALTPLGSLR